LGSISGCGTHVKSERMKARTSEGEREMPSREHWMREAEAGGCGDRYATTTGKPNHSAVQHSAAACSSIPAYPHKSFFYFTKIIITAGMGQKRDPGP